jgi:hypothetical protein
MDLDDSISLVYLIFWEIARFLKAKCDRLKKTNICRKDPSLHTFSYYLFTKLTGLPPKIVAM